MKFIKKTLNLDLFQHKLLFLVSLPVVANFLINIFTEERNLSYLYFSIPELLGGTSLLLFLGIVGNTIKYISVSKSISEGIVIYLFSFITLDYLFIFINNPLSFETTFLFTNISWFFLFLIKKVFSKVLLVLCIYFSNNILNYFISDMYFKNRNITGDVEAVFLHQTRNIFDNSYYFSMSNPVMDGYPQFLSYIQAIFAKLVLNNLNYEVVSVANQIVLFLFFLFIYELNLKKSNKAILIIFTTSLIFNSKWLTFLFFNSLMGEGLLSYLFLVLLHGLAQNYQENNVSSLPIVLFGFLALSKHFIIEIVLLVIIFLFLKSRRFIYFLGFVPFIVNQVQNQIYFKTRYRDHHISQIDFLDTFLDLLFLRDLNFLNLKLLSQKLLIDRPFTYLLSCMFILLLLRMKYGVKLNNFQVILIISILANFIFVICLYISVWKNMELDSPIRYFLNFLYSYIVLLFTFNKEKLEIRNSF